MRRIRGSHQSSVLSEMSSQFHDECSAAPGPLLHRDVGVLGRGAHELGLRADDVDDGMEADRLRDHTTPAGVEGAEDVALGFGRRGGRQEEGILEPNPRELDGSIDRHEGLARRLSRQHTAGPGGVQTGGVWRTAGRSIDSSYPQHPFTPWRNRHGLPRSWPGVRPRAPEALVVTPAVAGAPAHAARQTDYAGRWNGFALYARGIRRKGRALACASLLTPGRTSGHIE